MQFTSENDSTLENLYNTFYTSFANSHIINTTALETQLNTTGACTLFQYFVKQHGTNPISTETISTTYKTPIEGNGGGATHESSARHCCLVAFTGDGWTAAMVAVGLSVVAIIGLVIAVILYGYYRNRLQWQKR